MMEQPLQKLDLATDDLSANLDCDVCIIGAGPAGLTIARELSSSRLRVMVLESGGYTRQDCSDELDEIESTGWPRVQDQWLVRNRIVGGASHTWSGRCVPFDEIDFERRDWIPHSGWPQALGDITAYLDRSAPYLGLTIGSGFAGESFWGLAGRRRPVAAFNESLLLSHFWQFSRDEKNPSEHTRFGRYLEAERGANVSLVANATVCQLNVNIYGKAVESVEFAAPDGRRLKLAAKIVILSAGGIENARLLLCSNRVSTAGVGNQNDQVGRYLMDHLRGPVATFEVKGAERLRKQFGHYRVRNNQVFAHGMRLSPSIQHAEKLVNCSTWLEGHITDDDPWNILKRWLKGKPELARDAAAMAAGAGLLARGAKDYFVDRNGLMRKIDRLNLISMCEQIPDSDSRLTLADKCDRFDMPRARIDWRVHDIERQTMRRMAELVALEFSRLGLPLPRPEQWVHDNLPLPASFQDVAHPIGTTRMGESPTTSVVNPDCQIHGVHGAFIAGSSVFPTSSHANPTQMIVALAIRLADTIKSKIQT